MNTQHHAFDDIIATIQQRWGRQALYIANDPPAVPSLPPIPTGFPDVDAVFRIPRNRITELIGTPTAGMTTFLLQIMRQAQTAGDNVLYCDLDNTFDPDYAARCGVHLDKLVLAQPDTLNSALEITRDLLRCCRIGLLVIDFTLTRKDDLPNSTLVRQINGPLGRSGCALIFLVSVPKAHEILSLAISPHSALRLVFQRQRWLHNHQDVRGCESTITVVKNKHNATTPTLTITIPFDPVAPGD
jgi:recombination protein RecA